MSAVATGMMVTEASAADTVSLRLDYLPQGYHAPLFYGLKNGIYEKHGIDLTISDGTGTNASLQAVAAGNDQVVLANLSTMMQSVGQGMPVLAIGGLVQRLPDAILALEGSGITKPKDIEGKTMSIPPASAIFKILPAFAAAADIDLDKVRLIQMQAAATQTALLQGQVDVTTGWAFTQGIALSKEKPIEEPILISDYGINMLGAGFVVKKDFAENNGDLLKRFMAATVEAFDEGFKNPQAAVDALVEARPQLDAATQLEMLELFPPYAHSDASEGKPFGWMAREDWEKTADILTRYFDMKEKVDIEAVYTNEFIPM